PGGERRAKSGNLYAQIVSAMTQFRYCDGHPSNLPARNPSAGDDDVPATELTGDTSPTPNKEQDAKCAFAKLNFGAFLTLSRCVSLSEWTCVNEHRDIIIENLDALNRHLKFNIEYWATFVDHLPSRHLVLLLYQGIASRPSTFSFC